MQSEFLKLVSDHGLTSPQIAQMLGVSVYTVNAWRAKSRHDISAPMLELLRIKIEQKSA